MALSAAGVESTINARAPRRVVREAVPEHPRADRKKRSTEAKRDKAKCRSPIRCSSTKCSKIASTKSPTSSPVSARGGRHSSRSSRVTPSCETSPRGRGGPPGPRFFDVSRRPGADFAHSPLILSHALCFGSACHCTVLRPSLFRARSLPPFVGENQPRNGGWDLGRKFGTLSWNIAEKWGWRWRRLRAFRSRKGINCAIAKSGTDFLVSLFLGFVTGAVAAFLGN